MREANRALLTSRKSARVAPLVRALRTRLSLPSLSTTGVRKTDVAILQEEPAERVKPL